MKQTEYIGMTDLNRPGDLINGQRDAWSPGIWRQLPQIGVAGLLGMLACIIACCAIIIASDGKETTSWHVQPSVLLALVAAAGNTLLGVAFSSGATVSWWKKALQGCSVRDLHQHWDASTGFLPALKLLARLQPIALASLLVALVAIDGPLLQRASTIVSVPRSTPRTLHAGIAEEIPLGFTGRGLNYSGKVDIVTPAFSKIMAGFTQRTPIDVTTWGCNGTCVGSIPGAGLQPICTQTLNSSFRVFNSPYPPFGTFFDLDFGVGYGDVVPGLNDGFYVHLTLDAGVGNTAPNNTAFFANTNGPPPSADYPNSSWTPPCYGTYLQTSCKLMPALIDYRFRIQNNTLTLTDDDDDAASAPTVIRAQKIPFSTDWADYHYGGIAYGLQNLFRSTFSIAQDGPDLGLATNITGSMAQNYLLTMPRDNKEDLTGWGCAYNFSDPMPDMLKNVYELMFRTALGAGDDATGNATAGVTFGVVQTENTLVFRSEYGYLAGAMVVMVVALVSVGVTFFGWWTLGRALTLSPVEIARSFSAPLLGTDKVSPGSDLDTFIDKVGSLRLRYGEVSDSGGGGGGGGGAIQTLAFGHEGAVESPREGGVY